MNPSGLGACFIINYWFNFFDLGLFSLSISSILKNSFVGYRILEWQPFSFSTLNISTRWYILASSDEKWAVNLIEELFLSCCSQESLSLSLDNLTMMCIVVGLLSLSYMEHFSTNWGSFQHGFEYSFCPFLLSPSGIPIMCLLVCLWYPTHLWGFVHFLFFTPFSFCSFEWIISIDLTSISWILFSTRSNLPLRFVGKFSFQLFYFPTAEFLWFVFMISILDIHYLVTHHSHTLIL